MKIAFFLPSLAGGGAERSILTLANALADKGYAVDLLLVKKEGPYIDKISPKLRVIDFNKERALKAIFPLRNYLKSEVPSILVTALRYTSIISAFVMKTIDVNTKLILSERNSFIYSGKLKGFIYKKMTKWAYQSADCITTVSNDVSDQICKILCISRSKIHTIYNPVVTDELKKFAKLTPEHPWLIGKTSKIILSAGRLTKQKDFPTLIRAFYKVQKTDECKLIILGEGEERLNLESLIKELKIDNKVSMPGFVDNPFSYMRHSDLFVLSSLWEGLPGVLIQAMACGTPVISTDCPGGSREILENGKWGGLVPVGDSEKLSDEIKRFFQKDKSTDESQKRSEVFTVDNSVSMYEKLFETLN